MSDWRGIAGGTILIPTGYENHLYIILSDPQNFEGYTPNSSISVNVSTIRNSPYDDTCKLEGGCHPFIKHDSYIAYRYARIDPISELEAHVQAGSFIPQDPIDNGCGSFVTTENQ